MATSGGCYTTERLQSDAVVAIANCGCIQRQRQNLCITGRQIRRKIAIIGQKLQQPTENE
jgi:hypothetical protein